MTENDIIKPVEGPQNIGVLNPIQGHTEKKRRQPEERRKRTAETQPAETLDENATNTKPSESEDDRHSIDYCA
jgi:hypothetical protein